MRDIISFYNASDATKITLRVKPLKVEKEENHKNKVGRPKKSEEKEPNHSILLSFIGTFGFIPFVTV